MDKRNVVIFFSNQNREVFEKWFVNCPNLWMAAERGYMYKTGADASWEKLIDLPSRIWLPSVIEMLNNYSDNIDGAVVQKRESSIIWNHRNVDEE